jgi:tetratricopeptide (TPR) repeat protein
MIELVIAVGVVLVLFSIISLGKPAVNHGNELRHRATAHEAYVQGDAASMKAQLDQADLNTLIFLNTALGRYEMALQRLKEFAPEILVLTPPFNEGDMLIRVNAAEALFELGRFDEALALIPHQSIYSWNFEVAIPKLKSKTHWRERV